MSFLELPALRHALEQPPRASLGLYQLSEASSLSSSSDANLASINSLLERHREVASLLERPVPIVTTTGHNHHQQGTSINSRMDGVAARGLQGSRGREERFEDVRRSDVKASEEQEQPLNLCVRDRAGRGHR